MTEPTERVRIDMAEMTLRELSAVGKLLAPATLADTFTNDQPLALAALACVVKQRTDPTYTFEQACDLKMGELDLTGQSPEALSGSNGETPRLSLESGVSTPTA